MNEKLKNVTGLTSLSGSLETSSFIFNRSNHRPSSITLKSIKIIISTNKLSAKVSKSINLIMLNLVVMWKSINVFAFDQGEVVQVNALHILFEALRRFFFF